MLPELIVCILLLAIFFTNYSIYLCMILKIDPPRCHMSVTRNFSVLIRVHKNFKSRIINRRKIYLYIFIYALHYKKNDFKYVKKNWQTLERSYSASLESSLNQNRREFALQSQQTCQGLSDSLSFQYHLQFSRS